MSAEEEKEKLSSLVAKLREVFPFPKEKDYDNGYDCNKKDGWHLAEIIGSPVMCLETMIEVCEGMKADASTKPSINYDGVLATVPYQCCPVCGGTGKTIADGFTSSVYQTCKVCNGACVIPQHIVQQALDIDS